MYKSYRQAINEALHEEMELNEKVLIFGIDVADHKATFGSGDGITAKFGKHRCFSTPLSEDAMSGFSLGCAINGFRPINVHMRVDFLLLCMNQISNMISSYSYGSNGKIKVPIVFRAIIGRGWGQSYQHSKSMHSIFAHIPGLKVVMPATPNDAKGLLKSAIRDDNPVLVFEHRWLYDVEGEVFDSPLSLSGSNVLKEGFDITIVATSWMVVEAMKAAEILSKHNIYAEIINCYSITHFNEDSTIIDSVKKTGKCIVADNDWNFCGFGSELSSYIHECCFGFLKCPVSRIGFKHSPCPCSRALENAFYPNAIDIINEVQNILQIKKIDLSDEIFFSYENKFRGPF